MNLPVEQVSATVGVAFQHALRLPAGLQPSIPFLSDQPSSLTLLADRFARRR